MFQDCLGSSYTSREGKKQKEEDYYLETCPCDQIQNYITKVDNLVSLSICVLCCRLLGFRYMPFSRHVIYLLV